MAKSIIFSIVLTVISTLNIFGQKTTSNSKDNKNKDYEKIEQRLDVLEGQKENLDKQSELLKSDFELKFQNLKSDFRGRQIEINQSLSTVKLINSIVGIGLFGMFIGALFYFKQFARKTAEKIAEDKIKKVLENIVQDKKRELIELINNQNIESKIKEESNLLVITESESSKESLQTFFNKVGIKKVVFELSEKFKTPPPNTDLIILDDHEMTGKRHDLFREYIDRLSTNEMLFIFLGDRFDISNRKKVNFANTNFTFYNQIVNSLKFKEVINLNT